MQEQPQQKHIIFTANQDKKPENPAFCQRQTEEISFISRSSYELKACKSDCPDTLLNYTQGNGLVSAVHLAYQDHFNLELSPDDIWLAILQAFASHMELNHEKLRKQFVDFDGQKNLQITRQNFIYGQDMNQWDWASCFEDWCEQVEKNIGKQNHQNLVPKFSTTNQISSACFNTTLLNSMKEYFRIRLAGGCGIPQVKLTGTLEDWQKIRSMTANLGQYDLEWWTSLLLPILDKFIETYEGKVDNVFWNCIYKEIPPYGSEYGSSTTGWILNFFPYIQLGQLYHQNSTPQKIKSDFLRPLEEIYENYLELEAQDKEGIKNILERKGKLVYGHKQGIKRPFGGMTETNFEFENLLTNKVYDMSIISGFHNVCYEDGFIKPAKGWAIVEKGEKLQERED